MDVSDEQLVRAWKELPNEQRRMLFLIDIERVSEEDVAAIMKIPVVIVKRRAMWARALLKKNLLSNCRKSSTCRK